MESNTVKITNNNIQAWEKSHGPLTNEQKETIARYADRGLKTVADCLLLEALWQAALYYNEYLAYEDEISLQNQRDALSQARELIIHDTASIAELCRNKQFPCPNVIIALPHHTDFLPFAIENKLEINKRYKTLYKETLLHTAAEYLNIPSTRLLLKAGANINTQDNSGHTPLMAVYRRWQQNLTIHNLEYAQRRLAMTKLILRYRNYSSLFKKKPARNDTYFLLLPKDLRTYLRNNLQEIDFNLTNKDRQTTLDFAYQMRDCFVLEEPKVASIWKKIITLLNRSYKSRQDTIRISTP